MANDTTVNHICVDPAEYAELEELTSLHSDTQEVLTHVCQQITSLLEHSLATIKLSPTVSSLLLQIEQDIVQPFIDTHQGTEDAMGEFLREMHEIDSKS